VGVGVAAGVPPPPYCPPGGTTVVRVDQPTAPVGALTEGAVPQALKVVVKVRTTPPPETVDLYVIGRSVLGAMSIDPVPGGRPLEAGTTPESLVAVTPPATVTLALEAGVSGSSVAWLAAVIPGCRTVYGPLPFTTVTHFPSTLAAVAVDTPS
jgi:hypothetical protein